MRRWSSVAVLLLLCCTGVSAQVAPAATVAPTAADDVVEMDTVVVSGVQPGPGMWKVSKGGNVLYILGTLSPLPRRMQWLPDDVERVIARSQAVIDPPSVELDAGIGKLRSLMLLPSLLKARRNPDGQSLRDVVAPDLYARWSVLKPRYLGRNAGIESWRPIFAAQELYEGAMDRNGLSQKNVVQPVVAAAARRHRVPRIATTTTFVLKDAKAAVREFRTTALADGECFAKTMLRIETDLEAMRVRANAWAVGDVAALRAMPLDDQYLVCTQALTQSGLAQRLGLGDVRARVGATWMAAADKALDEHAVSFATLPLSSLLRSDGFLARLRSKGYVIEEP